MIACLFRRGALALLLILLCAPATASVRVAIDGIRGATLRGQLEQATTLAAYRDRPISEAQVRRLFERAPDELRQALEPHGYYRPEISSELTREGDQWLATFGIRVIASAKINTMDFRFDGVSLDEDGQCLFGADAAPVLDLDPDLASLREQQATGAIPAAADGPGSRGADRVDAQGGNEGVAGDDVMAANGDGGEGNDDDDESRSPRNRLAALAGLERDDPERCLLLQELVADFELQPEDRLVHSRYESGKAAAQAAIEGRGYLLARLETSRVDVTVDEDQADIQLHWRTGPRFRMGETLFEGAQFGDDFMQRFVEHEPGVFYDSDELLKLQRRLIDADYFGFVSVSPQLRQARDGVVPILVNVAPAPRNVYTGGIAFGTDSGFGVRGSLQRRWVNTRGHRANIEAEVSQRLTAAAANYEIFRPGPDQRSLNFGLTHRREETNTSESETTSLFAVESRRWRGWQRDLGLRALYGDFTIAEERGNSTLLFAESRLTRGWSNHDLYPTQGYSLQLEARGGSEALLSDTDFAQLRGQFRWIHPLGERQRLYMNAIAGTTWVDDFHALPPPLRFFAGGDQTIRGYSYQALGPKVNRCGFDADDPDRCDDFVIGGKHLAVLSAEFERDILPQWSIAGFVDSGNAFSDTSDFKAATGVGIGVRWRSPVGLVRVDLGHGLDEDAKTISLHLVIGPYL